MNPQDHSNLDGEELLHLAIEATQDGRHGDAIQYLKQAVAKAGDARLLFLLGAEHAQIGLFDRAVEDMTAALELDPDFAPARFQLGLMHLVRGAQAEASAVWKPLDSLPETDPYPHFKRGLEYLAQNESKHCRESLAKGIALNHSNVPLNRDMQRILDDLAARETGAERGKPTSEEQAPHVLLSSYTHRTY
jgi:tetratricopeptide (TPR) repeat protein